MPDDKNPLAVEEDFMIEVLEPGPTPPSALQAQEDLEYFLKKLYSSLNVPRRYLAEARGTIGEKKE